MSVIIKDMEMPKTCSQCEIWSKCWDERPFWFERLECCPLTEKADRKTEPSVSEKSTGSEKPNNCEDLQDWKDRMWAEAIVTEPTCSKMEQVDEPKTDCNGCKFVGTYDTEFPCANCSRKTKDYYAKDEPQTERKDK